MPRIDDKIREREEDECFFSVEFFPPKTDAGVANLYDRLERMSLLKPLFIAVTWGSQASTAELSTDICIAATNILGQETLMHITCSNIAECSIDKYLQAAHDKGIQNLFCLRGDPQHLEDGFEHAIDFVKYVRKKWGNYFCIAVAGYPEGHAECNSYEQDLQYLKEKVDAGADIIITQLVYDADVFLKYVKDCRDIGITVPIIPGIMPIHSYNQYRKMLQYCKTEPTELIDLIESIKNDDDAVKAAGVTYIVKLIRELQRNGVRGFHLFSLNLEWCITRIVDELGLVDESIHREFPWRQSANPSRLQSEEVRPIFWANRPKSYMARTMRWDDFPNGRWGDSRSPAFGEVDHHHRNVILATTRVDVATFVQSPDTIADLVAVFVNYLNGKITGLPWFEQPLALESSLILDKLVKINKLGCLTINSQPSVNGVPSDDANVGWGPKGGYVYQKEYMEFFCSPNNAEILRTLLTSKFPFISYMMTNRSASVQYSNVDSPVAVTWGVFPGREIQQPTVVDPFSFRIWKDEAFDLWVTAYHGRRVPRLVHIVHETWLLVTLVQNDYINGDLWDIFGKAAEHDKWQHPSKGVDISPMKKRASLSDILAEYLDADELLASETAKDAISDQSDDDSAGDSAGNSIW
eukprot:TRINITY_DN64897_c0_g1_i1.p1 TRINITY_DN64897_c0_g1~~TRINITY_DN64897_c0_g1_i1.p1  ORF type:complete len:637 (-),score=53.10 TRINITY_DN64897_c0_g1_i1:2189-4099(-)